MDINEFIEEKNEEETTELVRVDEGQLILAKQLQQQLIEFETTRKTIEAKEKELKEKLYEVMKKNGIEKYESNDKRVMISLGKDGITETIDKERLFLDYPDAYRECVTESKRKGTLRITIREAKDGEM